MVRLPNDLNSHSAKGLAVGLDVPLIGVHHMVYFLKSKLIS